MRHYTGMDRLIQSFDQALRSLVPGATTANVIIPPIVLIPI